MANLSQTPASVIKGTGAVTATGTAGATITAGQPVYADSADLDFVSQPKLKVADANVSVAVATTVGIALHNTLNNQPITYQTSGVFALGAALAQDMPYVVSNTVGAICPIGDITNTEFLSVLGRATSNTVFTMGIVNPTAALGADIA